MSTTMSVANQTKRKRARMSRSPDSSDESKKRGRPRVEKQDASAADRRRTQIRMAQRAYRQRKESTLDELRRRVSELTTTLERMNKTFEDCRARLSAAPLPDAHLHDLHEMSMQYANLMKVVRNPREDGSASPVELGTARPTSTKSDSREDAPQLNSEIQNVASWLDEGSLTRAQKQQEPMDIGWGYRVYMPGSEERAEPFDYFNSNQQTQGLVPASLKSGLIPADLDVIANDMSTAFQIPSELTPPITYSFQETSLARRLHRSCLEAGYQLLLDPTRRPKTRERVFRLSMLGKDRAKLTASMKAMLDRGPHESLDFWEAPLIHVGGAGTHYARKDPFGNLIPKKESYNLGIVGPQTLALLENAAQNNLSTDMTIEVAGYEGEWYDPYDVEGYLEEKGIYIDPSASFVEAEIVEWPSTPSSGTTISSGMPQTPPGDFSTPDRVAPFNQDQVDALDVWQADPSKWDDSANMAMTGVGYSDASTGSWMNFIVPGQTTKAYDGPTGGWHQPVADDLMAETVLSALSATVPLAIAERASNPSMPASPLPRRKSVLIDVTKFVKVLTVSGVCLGRTPGFKRRDVDHALAISSFDV